MGLKVVYQVSAQKVDSLRRTRCGGLYEIKANINLVYWLEEWFETA